MRLHCQLPQQFYCLPPKLNAGRDPRIKHKSSALQSSNNRVLERRNTQHKDSRWCRATNIAWQLSSSTLENSASVPDFEVIKIPGNGSCMFQAIAQAHHQLETGTLLTDDQLHNRGFELRRAICFLLNKNREDLAPFIPGSFEAYLLHMSQEGVWGGEPELAMAAQCLKRPVLVYGKVKSSIFGDSLSKTSEYGIDEYRNVPPVCVLFDNFHYNTLLVKG